VVRYNVPIPVAVQTKTWDFGRSLTRIVGSNPTWGMDVCVLCCCTDGSIEHKWHEGQKGLNSTKMDQRGKTPDREKKKSHRGHGCLCCVCCKDGSMERKVTWRTKGFKQYKNGSKGKKPRTDKKKSHLGHGCLSVVSVVCCQVEVSATGWFLVQRSPTECGPTEWGGLGTRKGAVEP
jgi:hypothetical protein